MESLIILWKQYRNFRTATIIVFIIILTAVTTLCVAQNNQNSTIGRNIQRVEVKIPTFQATTASHKK